MKVEQLYTKCLAQGAYFIESNGEAAVIDPLREVDEYIEMAKERNVKIKYIFETHFHADFVSGHVTLAEKTGATIVFGPMANTKFDAYIAKDGEEFKIGDLTIRVLHTPGHTMESTTYLLIDENGKNNAIFSGDTLFLGDVGRPDLAQKAADMTQEQLAAHLYHSLRTKIMPLEDEVIVYPGHGAGSACGKNMMKETVDTLGNQKKVNYALRADMTVDEFVKEVTDGLLPPPYYFPYNVAMNKEGYIPVDEILKRGETALEPSDVKQFVDEKNVLVLDVRTPDEFAKGHIPGALFIGLDGQFAPWVGALIKDIHQPIVLVTPEGRENETVTRLARVGYDNTLGYLAGGVQAWKDASFQLASVTSVPALDFEANFSADSNYVLDVRKESEYLSEHVVDARNLPLDFLEENLNTIDTSKTFYVHCAGGYRSMIASSILKANGIDNFIDIKGGFAAVKETNVPKTDYVCPSTLK
jgi:hydroxyacylglutathione hydrolase